MRYPAGLREVTLGARNALLILPRILGALVVRRRGSTLAPARVIPSAIEVTI